MKVLLVNYFWYRRSGGEAHVLDLAEMLEQAGHEVVVFSMQHPENLTSEWQGYWPANVEYRGSMTAAQQLRAAGRSIYSREVARALERLIAVARPDVAHIHGIHHQLTVSVIDQLKRSGVPTVWTLHDYRCVCPATSLLRRRRPCTRCAGGSYWHAVAGRCKSRSVARSGAAAVESYVARLRGTLTKVDCYVSPSEYLASTVRMMGLPAKRLEVLPNFTAAGPVAEWRGGERFVFVGRLNYEKGLAELLDALALVDGAGLVVLGEGPDADDLHARAVELDLPVEFKGWVGEDEVRHIMATSRALVLPSLWYENCPLAVVEAMVAGLPVIASDLGGIPELLDHGRCGTLVPAADTGAWAAAMRRALRDGDEAAAAAARGRERVRRRHDRDRYLQDLLCIYGEVAR